MKPKHDSELVDQDNPELSETDFAHAVPLSKLPKSLQTKLATRTRGPQKLPAKVRISLRLSAEVLEQFRATGDGWHSRVDAALKDWLDSHTPK